MLIAVFVFFLIIGVPIAFVLGLVGLFHLAINREMELLPMMMQRMIDGANNFVLVAVPMFMLVGNLMNAAGITQRLINLSNALVGWLRGGLGHVSVVVSMIFAGITGIATAETSALGTTLIPAMEKQGYGKEFPTGLVCMASCIGAIIPPSVSMVLFSVVGEVSTGKLFAAGFFPGIMMGSALMGLVAYYSHKRKYPIAARFSLSQLGKAFVEALPALTMPVVMVGGLLIGWFSPTEASAVGVSMAFFIGVFVYRELKMKALPQILWQSGRLTAAVMVLVACAAVFSWTLSMDQVPKKVAQFILNLTENKFIFLLYINMLLLFVGTFMDITASILILTPILLPIAIQLGVDPIHFGLIMVMNLVIGVVTPPVGIVLFVATTITGLTFEQVVKSVVPFLIASLVVLGIATYWERGVLFIPDLLFPK
jgi:C4-dicarboxylate transporter, DctM subunit